MLPNCRTTTRMSGIGSPGWRRFTDGGFKRQVDGTELAGWGTAAVSPDNFVRILFGPVSRDPRHPAFLGASAATTPWNSSALPKPSDGLTFSFLAAKDCVSFMFPSTLHVLPLVLITLKGALPWPTNAMSWCCGPKADFISRSTVFLATRGMPGMSALILQPTWA